MKVTTPRLAFLALACTLGIPDALAAPISPPETSPNPAHVLAKRINFTMSCINGYYPRCTSTYHFYCNQYSGRVQGGTDLGCLAYCRCNPITNCRICNGEEEPGDDANGGSADGDSTDGGDTVSSDDVVAAPDGD